MLVDFKKDFAKNFNKTNKQNFTINENIETLIPEAMQKSKKIQEKSKK